MPESGRNSGGDLFDMAKDGTTVPDDSAKPRVIPSVPRPDQIASASDPNALGGTNLAEAATNATDIPRVGGPAPRSQCETKLSRRPKTLP